MTFAERERKGLTDRWADRMHVFVVVSIAKFLLMFACYSFPEMFADICGALYSTGPVHVHLPVHTVQPGRFPAGPKCVLHRRSALVTGPTYNTKGRIR